MVGAKHRLRPRTAQTKLAVPLGTRWVLERTNSWLSNFGQLCRNNDHHIGRRLVALARTVALIIAIKLIR